jgi:hypothetical protein
VGSDLWEYEVRELTQEDLDRGNLIDIFEMIGMHVEGEIDDGDGYGYAVIDGDVDDTKELSPSDFAELSDDVTDILWFNT